MIRRLGFLALVVALLTVSASPVSAGELDRELSKVKDQISGIRSEMNEATAQQSELSARLVDALDLLEKAETRVRAATTKVERIERELTVREQDLADVRSRLAETFAALAETRASRDEARSEAESWAMDAYMGGGAAQPSIAFSATAIVDVSVGVAYLDVLTDYSSSAADRYQAAVEREASEEAQIEDLEATIVADVAALEATKQESAMLAGDLEATRVALADEYEAQATLLDEVEVAVAEFEGELASLGREEASIRRKIAEAAAAAAATKPRSSSSAGSSSTGSGRLLRPIPGAIESGFGMRVHPITGKTRMHNGLDMHGNSGDPIRAAADGKVIFAGVKGGYGNAVMIDHGGGMVTLYAHQSKLLVKEGQRVDAGDVIGLIGSTGLSTGPHLHFEVRINGAPVDAAKYL
ncbi:Membrane proteins related to metalloendopeptidases [hydrothermal vent metagenome]|uniref:Membrane proteins related to metalloendopeptidases n=1 Tax=hydrothermal vent metagenome TaxID=652676 RepID=A0A3B0RMV9_9ZZZZ